MWCLRAHDVHNLAQARVRRSTYWSAQPRVDAKTLAVLRFDNVGRFQYIECDRRVAA
jgi:hypothetical protein